MGSVRTRRVMDGDLGKKTLAYLRTQPDVWAERRNSGNLRGVWLGEPGTPDVCGQITKDAVRTAAGTLFFYKHTVYFGIETKCKGGKLNPAQRKFHEKAAKWGMPVCTVETLDDVKLFLEGLRR